MADENPKKSTEIKDIKKGYNPQGIIDQLRPPTERQDEAYNPQGVIDARSKATPAQSDANSQSSDANSQSSDANSQSNQT